MKSTLTLFSLIFLSFFAFGQEITVNDSPPGQKVTFNKDRFISGAQTSNITNGLVSNFLNEFPTPTGTQELVFNETLVSTEKIPGIQTYEAKSKDNSITMHITFGTQAVTGIMRTPTGYYYFEPDPKGEGYILYNQKDLNYSGFQCNTLHEETQHLLQNSKGRAASTFGFPYGSNLRKLRMAAAATGEFTQNFGTKANALSQIVAIINAANLIYQTEASIKFELITKTTDLTLIFDNPSTDPFDPSLTFASAEKAQEGFTAMHSSSILNYNEYDTGHTFGIYTSSGISARGEAGPTPCLDTFKSRGWTEWSTGTTPTYYWLVTSVFVHEVGHQFFAPHTYNAQGGPNASNTTFCTSGWSNTGAIEPGSGSTIMGYGTNCQYPNNYTLNGDNNLNYFNAGTLDYFVDVIAHPTYGGCITNIATGNNPPAVTMGSNITIPKGTPFKLSATATDADGDPLSYTWEQADAATANDRGAFGRNTQGVGGYTAANSTTAPLFRSWQSTSTPTRYLPSLDIVLNHGNNAPDNYGETLPEVVRSIKFRFTARDGKTTGGGVDSDEITVNVVNAGPFLITSQNTPTLWLYDGTNTATINWSVNGTNTAPLNVANVKISLSTDGGQTFPHVLAASTPNDGSHTIVIPNQLTSTGRIKIEPTATDNFYDINNINITISTNCTPETITFAPTNAVSEDQGDPNLDLNLNALGSPITNISGSIVSTDPTSYLTVNNGASGCTTFFGNVVRYKQFPFIVPTAGTYTFNYSNYPIMINIYSAPFEPGLPCNNFVKSSGTFNGSSIPPTTSVSATLTPGVYYLVVTTFSSTTPTLPASFSVNNAGLPIYNSAPGVGSPYDYTYIVKHNATDNIIEFTQNPDLSSYPAGIYTIHAMSYQGGLDLSVYENTSYTTFAGLVSAGTVCGEISSSTKNVTVVGPSAPCPPTLSLSGAGSTGLSQASEHITSTQVITGAGVNVEYKAGKSIELLPLAGSGFSIGGDAVFKAEIGGCP